MKLFTSMCMHRYIEMAGVSSSQEKRISVHTLLSHKTSEATTRVVTTRMDALHYFPKETDFTTIADEEVARVELLLNTRPRKRLGYLTPLETMGVALGG